MGAAIELLKRSRLAAVVQAPERDDLIQRALAAAKGGIQMLALPVSVPFVAEIAAEVADEADVTVGLSDVVLNDHLNVALAAGAEFALSPIFDLELVQTGRARGLDVIPSVSTPNEIHNAARVHDGPLGVIPAHGLGGPDYVGWLHTAFPGTELVAMGGVGSDTAPQYLEEGAAAVIVDTGLFPDEMDPESAAIIGVRAGALVELCADAVPGERQSVA
ncbi:MAG TPA: bifunctional 4-hydroxy-2-oxoglutarate aldolase/2-dehydro-3-deoxy-phosphogluconate aldolase [Sandaracinaceae bacterium LLY-WYZ-13_1]|nr:bifunctional 4-hydroxy-2-oxoglutarate aldolase/2-dehydro-3-deoxy-phosphogluconate aldolase [Sandaracinaceae bacterium LLY-WYZ-13_1]